MIILIERVAVGGRGVRLLGPRVARTLEDVRRPRLLAVRVLVQELSASLLTLPFHPLFLYSNPPERNPDKGERRKDDTSYSPCRGGARRSRYMELTGYSDNDDPYVVGYRK